jgi:periplasmic divalent cation tolerance protein
VEAQSVDNPALDPTLAAHLVVTTSLPTEADAARTAEAVVSERLAACAQVAGPIHSTFRWQGKLDRATEWYLHCKTTRGRYGELEQRLRQLHPYDTPEIIATPIIAGHQPYLKWVSETVEDGET